MLQVVVPSSEYYDEVKNEFIPVKGQVLQLEHSLVSISKWEAKWKKPFLTNDQKSSEEVLDYIKCMTLTQNVNPMIYYSIPSGALKEILDYISDPMSATVIRESNVGPKSRRSETVTSELIYYWMVALQIPFECQKWHFNRLMNLIRICEIKNTPPKKRSQADIMRSNTALNNARRAALHTKG